MKRISAIIFSLILLLSVISIDVYSVEKISVNAKAAVLYCVNNDTVIFEKNANDRLSMASTTKIMTALLTLEQNSPERVVTVSKDAVSVEGTAMGLKPGDKVNYYSLVCGMLLSSGNDAANVAAYSVSGNLSDFAVLMNKKAKEIGMRNTSFVTPSGLDAKNHFSTAYDMALLGAYAINNPDFREICSAKSKSVSFGNPEREYTLYNHNRLLSSVDGVFGIKTGFTKKSGRCLVSACERNGITLVCVTLNDPDDWTDHKKLIEYGFENCIHLDDDFTEVGVKVVGSDKKYVDVKESNIPLAFNTQNEGITRLILTEQFVYAPVKKGQKIGTALYYEDNGTLLCCVDLLSIDSAEYVHIEKQEKRKSIIETLKDFFRS